MKELCPAFGCSNFFSTATKLQFLELSELRERCKNLSFLSAERINIDHTCVTA